MAVQVLFSGKQGPLPITTTFMSPGDMPMYLEVQGSVFTSTANQMIGIQVAIDGGNVGTANLFSNGPTTHRALVGVYLPVKLNQGSHTLTLSVNSGGTISDYNDFYTAVLHY